MAKSTKDRLINRLLELVAVALQKAIGRLLRKSF